MGRRCAGSARFSVSRTVAREWSHPVDRDRTFAPLSSDREGHHEAAFPQSANGTDAQRLATALGIAEQGSARALVSYGLKTESALLVTWFPAVELAWLGGLTRWGPTHAARFVRDEPMNDRTHKPTNTAIRIAMTDCETTAVGR